MLKKTIDFLNIIILHIHLSNIALVYSFQAIILHIHLANIALVYSFQAERQKISLITRSSIYDVLYTVLFMAIFT
jgi:hypothetical protein